MEKNPEMTQNQQNNLPVKFLVVGRTASGKSSIVREVCKKLELKQVKSLTTRPPRDVELNNPDSDHYFVTDEEFESERDKGFVAYTEINDYKYATTVDEFDRSDIYVIDPKGIEYLKQTCGDKYKFVEIYIRVPFITAINRFIERGGIESEFKARFNQENLQFKEYEKKQGFDYHVLNDQALEDAVEKVCEIIKKNNLIM
jgi:guanylate kinase